jgi:hypothetical protein
MKQFSLAAWYRMRFCTIISKSWAWVSFSWSSNAIHTLFFMSNPLRCRQKQQTPPQNLLKALERRQNTWENVMKRNYNWFFLCQQKKEYEKWSCGMRWYLWNNSYGCTDATMNSYKRFMWKGEIFSRNWLPFSTPWNISSFLLLKHFSLIRLRVSCNATFISLAKKREPHVSVHHLVERKKFMVWLKNWKLWRSHAFFMFTHY